MSFTKFMEGFVDKVLVGTIATIVSLFLLFNYNVSLKGFEAGQTQARSVSGLAIRNKDAVVDSTGEAMAIIKNRFLRTDAASVNNPDPEGDVLKKLVAISAARLSLQARFADSAKLANAMEERLLNFYRESQFSDADAIKKLEGDFAASLEPFLKAFDRELAGVIAAESQAFSTRYFESLPCYSRPSFLFGGAVVASIVLLLIVFVTSKKDEPKPEPKPKRKR